MAQPRLSSFPRIRAALRFYRITSIITGIGLLLLVTEMVLKYTPIHLELFAGGSGGFLYFASVVPAGDCAWYSQFAMGAGGCEIISTGDGVNLSLAILVIHGWFYVVYLASVFWMWSLMRWGFGRFLLLALSGVVPFLSFVMEGIVAREVTTYLSEREQRAAEKRAAKAAANATDPSEEAAR
ncbi:DUF3817 domain-containing protein [Microbacterium indicum]|uniref:DUF3817 domain-containing protein n=1 Tax=Microbacterium indicum TaxID=358100 RepID=UPI0003FD6C00|nr:DUF3817 domain-containing protein [Microbacterium indicum]